MDLFSIPHLLIVLLVVMVLFGTNRLPEIGAGLGKAIRNFKQAPASWTKWMPPSKKMKRILRSRVTSP